MSEKVVPLLYGEVKASLIKSMENAMYIGFTTDGWTSRSNQSFVTFTTHFLDQEWHFHNCVLQTREMSRAHTGDNLAKLLVDSVLQEWNIPHDKVAAVTTYNAANMVVMVREAKLTHVKCFAHTLNLASQKALKVPNVNRVLSIIRRIVAYFHKSPKAFAIFREKQALLNLPSHKLKNDVITRWNSSYEMVDRYLEQQPAIQATLLTKDLRKSGDTHLLSSLSEVDMAIAEDIVQVMKPMETATTVMCDEQQPTLSVVFPLYISLLKSTHPTDTSDLSTVQDMKKAMHDDLKNRYQSDIDVSLLHNAAAMDPRFKDLPFLSDVERMTVFSNLAVEASSLVNFDTCEVSVNQEPGDHQGPTLPALPDLSAVMKPAKAQAKVIWSDSDTSSGSPSKAAKTIKLESTCTSGSTCAPDDFLGFYCG